MITPRILAALLLIGAPPTYGQVSACVDPTPADSAWWRYTRRPNPDGSVSLFIPEPPALDKGLKPEQLLGSYKLRLIPTVGPDRGIVYEALAQVDAATAPPFPAQVGVGLIHLAPGWPRYLSFAPDSGFDRTRQPIELMWLPEVRRLSFTIGNAGSRWTDSGVSLDVFTIVDSLLAGRWVDGGLGVWGGPDGVHPQGWFCLTRITS